MQAVVPRWLNALILKKTIIIQSTTTTHLAFFHSSPPTLEKWKNKWNNFDVRRGEQPTKNFIRYATREKRADAKKALKDLFFNSGSSKFTFEEALPETGGRWDKEQAERINKKGRSKSSARHATKAHRMRRKLRRERLFEDSDEYPHVFQATLGNRWYTWSFKSWEEPSFWSSTAGFEWREEPKGSKRRSNESDIDSETESDEESCVVGKYSDRTILGLPATGPLKIDDVKNAFRLAALRWHPDRHQGPSQATAEEKFKECVSAYKSLCDALSAA